jgi:hypothetical protein
MGRRTVDRKSWDEFRRTGLLWFVNTLLHTFGWAIVIEYDDEVKDAVVGVYPARVTYRGFPKEAEDAARKNLAEYMRENADELYDEADYPSTPQD